jgi:hypothetical protein
MEGEGDRLVMQYIAIEGRLPDDKLEELQLRLAEGKGVVAVRAFNLSGMDKTIPGTPPAPPAEISEGAPPPPPPPPMDAPPPPPPGPGLPAPGGAVAAPTFAHTLVAKQGRKPVEPTLPKSATSETRLTILPWEKANKTLFKLIEETHEASQTAAEDGLGAEEKLNSAYRTLKDVLKHVLKAQSEIMTKDQEDEIAKLNAAGEDLLKQDDWSGLVNEGKLFSLEPLHRWLLGFAYRTSFLSCLVTNRMDPELFYHTAAMWILQFVFPESERLLQEKLFVAKKLAVPVPFVDRFRQYYKSHAFDTVLVRLNGFTKPWSNTQKFPDASKPFDRKSVTAPGSVADHFMKRYHGKMQRFDEVRAALLGKHFAALVPLLNIMFDRVAASTFSQNKIMHQLYDEFYRELQSATRGKTLEEFKQERRRILGNYVARLRSEIERLKSPAEWKQFKASSKAVMETTNSFVNNLATVQNDFALDYVTIEGNDANRNMQLKDLVVPKFDSTSFKDTLAVMKESAEANAVNPALLAALTRSFAVKNLSLQSKKALDALKKLRVGDPIDEDLAASIVVGLKALEPPTEEEKATAAAAAASGNSVKDKIKSALRHLGFESTLYHEGKMGKQDQNAAQTRYQKWFGGNRGLVISRKPEEDMLKIQRLKAAHYAALYAMAQLEGTEPNVEWVNEFETDEKPQVTQVEERMLKDETATRFLKSKYQRILKVLTTPRFAKNKFDKPWIENESPEQWCMWPMDLSEEWGATKNLAKTPLDLFREFKARMMEDYQKDGKTEEEASKLVARDVEDLARIYDECSAVSLFQLEEEPSPPEPEQPSEPVPKPEEAKPEPSDEPQGEQAPSTELPPAEQQTAVVEQVQSGENAQESSEASPEAAREENPETTPEQVVSETKEDMVTPVATPPARPPSVKHAARKDYLETVRMALEYIRKSDERHDEAKKRIFEELKSQYGSQAGQLFSAFGGELAGAIDLAFSQIAADPNIAENTSGQGKLFDAYILNALKEVTHDLDKKATAVSQVQEVLKSPMLNKMDWFKSMVLSSRLGSYKGFFEQLESKIGAVDEQTARAAALDFAKRAYLVVVWGAAIDSVVADLDRIESETEQAWQLENLKMLAQPVQKKSEQSPEPQAVQPPAGDQETAAANEAEAAPTGQTSETPDAPATSDAPVAQTEEKQPEPESELVQSLALALDPVTIEPDAPKEAPPPKGPAVKRLGKLGGGTMALQSLDQNQLAAMFQDRLGNLKKAQPARPAKEAAPGADETVPKPAETVQSESEPEQENANALEGVKLRSTAMSAPTTDAVEIAPFGGFKLRSTAKTVSEADAKKDNPFGQVKLKKPELVVKEVTTEKPENPFGVVLKKQVAPQQSTAEPIDPAKAFGADDTDRVG